MTPGERQMRADARRNYQRLVSVARDAFSEHGAEAPLDDIARRAGVGPGTLYRHFPTREALLAAVYRDEIAGLAEQADEFGRTLPAEQALAAFLRVELDYVKYKHGLGSAVKTMLGKDSETATWCRDILRSALGRLLTSAQQDGVARTDIDAADVLRLVHGVGMALESAPEQADRLLGFVLDGLRPQPPRATPPTN